MIAGILNVPWVFETTLQWRPASVDLYTFDDIAPAQSSQVTLWELAFNSASLEIPQGLVN
jgi:hypothetical protein